MEPKTQKQIEEMIESYEDLMERIDRISMPLGALEGIGPDCAEECDLTFGCSSIQLKWDEYDRRAEEEKQKQKKAATKLEQDRLVKEAKRYQSYLEMKEEYEGK